MYDFLLSSSNSLIFLARRRGLHPFVNAQRVLVKMDDEERPPRRPSLAVNQLIGNLANFPPLSDSPTSAVPATSAVAIAGDPRFRAPNEHHHQHPSSLSRAGGGAAKVAIPRAPNLSEQSNINKRVGHACESCRDQKTKCSGDRPTCQRCQDLGLTCLYGDRKRERTVKSLTQPNIPVLSFTHWLF
jgi:hypothetical protein